MLTHTVTTSIRSASGGTVVSQSEVFEADADENISDVVGAGTTLEVFVDVDVSQIESFFITSDKDVTLHINGVGDPDQPSIALEAKKAIWWNTDRLEDNPLVADITALFFVNAGTDAATVKAGFLVNEGSGG